MIPVDKPTGTEKMPYDPTLNEELQVVSGYREEEAISSKVVKSEVISSEYMYMKATLSELNSLYIYMCIYTYKYVYKSVTIMW